MGKTIIKYHFDKIITKAYNEVTQSQIINNTMLLTSYDYSIVYENIDVYFITDNALMFGLFVNFPWAHIYPACSHSRHQCCLGIETKRTLQNTYNKNIEHLEHVIHDYFLTMLVSHASKMYLPNGETHQDDIKLCHFTGKPYHKSVLHEIKENIYVFKHLVNDSYYRLDKHFNDKYCKHCSRISPLYKRICECGRKDMFALNKSYYH